MATERARHPREEYDEAQFAKNFPVHKLPDHLRRVGYGIVGNANLFPNTIEKFFSFTSKHNFNYIIGSINALGILDTTAPLLTPTYDLLNNKLTNPDTSVVDKVITIAIADALINQTSLPFQEKALYQVGRSQGESKKKQQALERFTEQLKEIQPATNKSIQTYEQLQKNIVTFLKTSFDAVTQPIDNPNEFKKKLHTFSDLQTFYNEGYIILAHYGSADLYQTLEDLYNNQFKKLSFNKLAIPLLLHGELDDYPPTIISTLWYNIIQDSRYNKINDEKILPSLLKYFFDHPSIGKQIWPLILNKERERDNEKQYSLFASDWAVFETFFLSSEENIQKLFTFFPADLPKKDKELLLRKLAGFTATFQKHHPDHENLPHIKNGLQELAQQHQVQSKLRSFFSILSDQTVGVIYFDPNHGPLTYTGAQDTFNSKYPEFSILYISKARSNIAKKENQPAKTAPIEKPLLFTLSATETIRTSHWGELPHVDTQKVPDLLTHLSDNFSLDEMYFDAAVERLSEQTPLAPPLYKKALVLTHLIPQSHDLARLKDVGILAMQRSTDKENNDAYTIIIDTTRAGIRVNKHPLIALTATRETQSLLINGAPKTFDGTILSLALTEAARLTHQNEPISTELLEKKFSTKYTSIKQETKAWKNETKGIIAPQVHFDLPDLTKDLAIVVPLNQQDAILLFTAK